VTDGVGQHYEISAGVQRLTWTEQFTAKGGSKQAGAGAGGAVQNQHRLPGGIADRRAVKAQFRQNFAGCESGNPARPNSFRPGCYEFGPA
jgi:hypothetical protein